MRTDTNKALVAKLYTLLKERIVRLELFPGQRIGLRDVAQEFGVSQIPLRDALNHLSKDGLIREVPWRG